MFKFDDIIEKESIDQHLLDQLVPSQIPHHIAIIMDGNGRWATQRGKSRIAGHRAGIQSIRTIVETSARLGISELTLYSFSVENWKRPRLEVAMLLKILGECLQKEIKMLQRNNIKLRLVGRISELGKTIQRKIQQATEITSKNNGMILNIAFNYGGRTELIDAFRAFANECKITGRSSDTITEEDISRNLYISHDPDLLIRTSGEMRISNFLLWQLAYTEIFVTNTLWPDFNRINLFEAILDFQQRNRRFGGVENIKQI